MAKKVTIGLIQMMCSDNPEKNLEKATASIKDCAAKGAQIVSLSELFLSLYFCQEKNDKYFELAETIPGPTTEKLEKLAKELNITIVGSIFEKASKKKYFNSTVVIGPDGITIGKYRKMHIPENPKKGFSNPEGCYSEYYYFKEGDLGFPVFETPLARISSMICYDQWFPEGARIVAAKGAQIIFYPTAIGWPLKSRPNGEELDRAEHEAWQLIQRSHGIANNLFIAVANRTGVEGEIKFWGTSFVSDPYGRVLNKTSIDKEENLVVTIDLNTIEEVRKEWPFLEERKIKYEAPTPLAPAPPASAATRLRPRPLRPPPPAGLGPPALPPMNVETP